VTGNCGIHYNTYVLSYRVTHCSKTTKTVFKPLSLPTVELLLTAVFKLYISVFKWLSLYKFECGYWKAEYLRLAEYQKWLFCTAL